MPDADLKLRKPNFTWDADKKIKGDVDFYPKGFYKNPQVHVSISASCHSKTNEIQAIKIFAQARDGNDSSFKAALSAYRTALKAVNPEMSGGAIDEILAGLKVGEPFPKDGSANISPAVVLDIGLTLDEFKQAYKSKAALFGGANWNIDGASVEVGSAQDIFSHEFTPNLVLQGAKEGLFVAWFSSSSSSCK